MKADEKRGSFKETCLLLVQLAGFSLAPALSFWAANVAHDPRTAALLAVSTVLFVIAALVLLSGGRRSRSALYRIAAVESVILMALFNWEALGAFRARPIEMVPAEHMLAVVLTAVLILIAFRFGPASGLRLGLFAMSLVVFLTGAVRVGQAELGIGTARLHEVEVPASGGTGSMPDIYYLVLDGYGRADVLRDDYDLDQTGFIERLTQRGFVVPPAATANYSLTVASIPSVLSMDFPIEPGTPLGAAQEHALNDVVRGSNPVARFLKGAGYTYVHVEGGLSASRCGRGVDRCVPWFPLDDSVMGLLDTTPLGPLLREQLQTWTTQETLDRFSEIAELARSSSPRRPRFVFAHLLVPHPPLFLRADCSIDVDGRRIGTTIGTPANRSLIDYRRGAYADQVRCVNRRLLELLEMIPSDAVVVLAGDHGPDSRAQLWKPLAAWTSEDVVERMSILAAYRLPEECRGRVPSDVSLVNTFRIVLGCVFDAKLPLLPNRTLLVSPGEVILEASPR